MHARVRVRACVNTVVHIDYIHIVLHCDGSGYRLNSDRFATVSHPRMSLSVCPCLLSNRTNSRDDRYVSNLSENSYASTCNARLGGCQATSMRMRDSIALCRVDQQQKAMTRLVSTALSTLRFVPLYPTLSPPPSSRMGIYICLTARNVEGAIECT